MQIRKLKLSGFKSFVEPAELRIEPGLTGIVGPNGCGKSNLLEAIRWVMGENSPRSMRSGGMDDVIFAGTEQRPQRDFAEVVLHALDDSDEDLEVMRRIERGAGSAYRVNGRDVRAKDIALVFADAATGAHSPALVSQGKIAGIISAKPTERRQMLEEAAGIAGLHVRRRDAESKLRQTETNLARLEDLMAGLDTQMSVLRRQAKQAERYKELSRQIQLAEARLLYARWRDAAEAADAARETAKLAEAKVADAQKSATAAQAEQAAIALKLTQARDEMADRRDDASAHGHRMASITSQLEAAEQRLADLNRQKQRLEEDRIDADRLTRDAAGAMQALEKELRAAEAALAADEERRPQFASEVEQAERASRAAELHLAKATADHAGVEAEWRVAQAEISQAKSRIERLDSALQRQEQLRAEMAAAGDTDAALAEARQVAEAAAERLVQLRAAFEVEQTRKDEFSRSSDETASALASARAELAGMERELSALSRDREARAKQAGSGMPKALDKVRAAKGYERALAAVLGRDAKASLGRPDGEAEGRFWTGGIAPAPVPDSLAGYISECPPELEARLALVHIAEKDDGRDLRPGEWLVTISGVLRRWDGFVSRGEGAAEAAKLEAENRLVELETQIPAAHSAFEEAERAHTKAKEALNTLRTGLIAAEREISGASEAERTALRAVDQAEMSRDRLAARITQLDESAHDLAEQRRSAEDELAHADQHLGMLPDPASGRTALAAAQKQNETARHALQSAMATLAAHDQSFAVARERRSARASDIKSWQARAGDAARRLAEMAARLQQIEEDRAVVAAKPAALIEEIEQGDEVRARLARELAAAEEILNSVQREASAAEARLADLNEQLSSAREARAGAIVRAENEESRREEMARISGERFQCPPSMLPGRFEFDETAISGAAEEGAELERLTASRERIGPVNLVAAEELEKLESQHGASSAEQQELTEAVHRLRGSIGNLNREGRERLRAAFEQVDQHFRRLFTRLFEGGQAHLALIDSDDPLEAGLEIYAQPPGKKLQSLSLLSGGEQALTATALIFGLFLTNPAPICVLDEVDAPLDDANIDRFCDLLDSMVAETRTRYLIVTHNAVTMSRMHRLFGVTMVEKGVSRLVSVDLSQAEAMAAE